ncbi:ribosomal-processing cysteine protease Prp [Megamonas funiformis]|jgi:uncharacterized protein YsxB (DUF464 family)|uniref:YsxB-like protein n=1 Tax=Siphoviridae sp. ctWdm1 TaxID=2827883 RepID=A0A8S5RYC4_9CAUD|nr:MAG TPA: YsxB-like protein [Siphoviridae sp. ctWdm1]
MIKICIETDGYKFIGYNIFGHANFAPKGKDIVCSAVSSIAQTAILGLNEILKKNIIFEQDISLGFLKVMINNPDKDSDLIIRTMALALERLEKIYPQNISVKYNKLN